MLDKLDIEIELNNVIEATNAQINQLAAQARDNGSNIHQLRNSAGDPMLGPLLGIKMDALRSLVCLQHEH